MTFLEELKRLLAGEKQNPPSSIYEYIERRESSMILLHNHAEALAELVEASQHVKNHPGQNELEHLSVALNKLEQENKE